MSERIIDVFLNYQRKDIQVGVLYVSVTRGQETHSFEFLNSYLILKKRFVFDNSLQYTLGRQYTNKTDKTFSFISDVTPDRWGKMLIQKYYRDNTLNPRALGESDYLLALNDETRLGALRFKLRKGEKPVITHKKRIPTFLDINHLANISYDINAIKDDELKTLLSPGSSLGGARPKAVVHDSNGNLYLAKFPNKQDTYDVELWEMVTNELAKLCKLNIPETKLITLPQHGHAFLVKRFDRVKDERLPYVSLMNVLDANDGESDRYSYLDFVDAINQHSVIPKEDLLELYKRIAFNIIVHNGDDHVRNHGFIYQNNGWSLAPVFDINISNEHQHLALSIDGITNAFDLNALIKTANFYQIKEEDAINIIKDMIRLIRLNLKIIAKKYHANNNEIKIFDKLVNNVNL